MSKTGKIFISRCYLLCCLGIMTFPSRFLYLRYSISRSMVPAHQSTNFMSKVRFWKESDVSLSRSSVRWYEFMFLRGETFQNCRYADMHYPVWPSSDTLNGEVLKFDICKRTRRFLAVVDWDDKCLRLQMCHKISVKSCGWVARCLLSCIWFGWSCEIHSGLALLLPYPKQWTVMHGPF